MLNYFAAGAEFVRWELLAVEQEGPYQLTMRHSRGVIVEYFDTMTAALARQCELEALMIAARTDGRAVAARPISM